MRMHVEEFKDVVDSIQTTEISKISLYALNGEPDPKTIHLRRILKGQKVSILIDSGSSHNFVQDDIARKLSLSMSPIPEFSVATGSGDVLVCSRMCKDTSIIIQGTTITTDLFVLKLEGANLVLGVQWMKSIGRILTDWATMSMEFVLGNSLTVWTSEPMIDEETLSSREFHHLAGGSRQAYLCRFEVKSLKDKDVSLEEDDSLSV